MLEVLIFKSRTISVWQSCEILSLQNQITQREKNEELEMNIYQVSGGWVAA